MAVFLVSGNLAGQPVAACPGRPPLTVQFAAERERVALSADLSLSELRSLSAQSGQVPPHMVLGFSTSSFHYAVQTTIEEERTCGEPVVVRLTLVLKDRQIAVAREVMDHYCLRDAALAHYHRHAEADNEAFTRLAAAGMGAVPLLISNRNHPLVGSQSSVGHAHAHCNGLKGSGPQSLQLGP